MSQISQGDLFVEGYASIYEALFACIIYFFPPHSLIGGIITLAPKTRASGIL
jgi:hypothetical protein